MKIGSGNLQRFYTKKLLQVKLNNNSINFIE